MDVRVDTQNNSETSDIKSEISQESNFNIRMQNLPLKMLNNDGREDRESSDTDSEIEIIEKVEKTEIIEKVENFSEYFCMDVFGFDASEEEEVKVENLQNYNAVPAISSAKKDLQEVMSSSPGTSLAMVESQETTNFIPLTCSTLKDKRETKYSNLADSVAKQRTRKVINSAAAPSWIIEVANSTPTTSSAIKDIHKAIIDQISTAPETLQNLASSKLATFSAIRRVQKVSNSDPVTCALKDKQQVKNLALVIKDARMTANSTQVISSRIDNALKLMSFVPEISVAMENPKRTKGTNLITCVVNQVKQKVMNSALTQSSTIEYSQNVLNLAPVTSAIKGAQKLVKVSATSAMGNPQQIKNSALALKDAHKTINLDPATSTEAAAKRVVNSNTITSFIKEIRKVKNTASLTIKGTKNAWKVKNTASSTIKGTKNAWKVKNTASSTIKGTKNAWKVKNTASSTIKGTKNAWKVKNTASSTIKGTKNATNLDPANLSSAIKKEPNVIEAAPAASFTQNTLDLAASTSLEMQIVKVVKIKKCDKCFFKGTKGALKAHRKKLHPNLSCNICSFKGTKLALKKHRKKLHPNLSNLCWTCNSCRVKHDWGHHSNGHVNRKRRPSCLPYKYFPWKKLKATDYSKSTPSNSPLFQLHHERAHIMQTSLHQLMHARNIRSNENLTSFVTYTSKAAKNKTSPQNGLKEIIDTASTSNSTICQLQESTDTPVGVSYHPQQDLPSDSRDKSTCEKLNSLATYTVPDAVLRYVKGTENMPREMWEKYMAQWRKDSWKGLYDPPIWLTPGFFLLAVAKEPDNELKRFMFIEAKHNLMMARATSSAITGNDYISGNVDWLMKYVESPSINSKNQLN